jgi:allantoin racemase
MEATMGFNIKICYLLPGVGMDAGEQKRRAQILNDIASSETRVEVRQVDEGPQSIENAIDEYHALPNVMRFVLDHQDEYDGIILGCAGDAGIDGAREQAHIPIVGPGESSLLLGTCGDRRFSMITVSDERAATKRKLVRDAGLDVTRLVSSYATGMSVKEMVQNPEQTKDRLVEWMKAAKNQGADVMILGCMTIAFTDPALLREAQREAGLTLVNPIVTAVKMAEALVAMQKY